MADFRLTPAEFHKADREMNRARALAALEALQALLEGLPLGTEIRSEHMAALLDATLALARDRKGANDPD